MGQAWCKEKSNKAQDSKSPLDRVFLRCAHRIYPSLKEEGSILGGATQRVTSSEIGYASSPPRHVLQRGQSMDSVDRPFHPSDWVDVNLEVPVTPRTASPTANLNFEAAVYPSTQRISSVSSGTNSRNFAPVPPPRRRKRNRDRPLPPKPDELSKIHGDRVIARNFKDLRNSNSEPLYSSVKLPRSWSNDKEIFEHKVNGTGRVISSAVVAASRSNRNKSSREAERNREKKNDERPKNSSTVSLPNFSELEVSGENLCEEGPVKIRKITAAESLPALITSGVLDNLKRSDLEKREKNARESNRRDESEKCGVDETDFSSNVTTKNHENRNSSFELEGPITTSTPLKECSDKESRLKNTTELETENSSINKPDQYGAPKTAFDRPRDPRSDSFFEVEESEIESEESRGRISVVEKVENSGTRRSLSNESEALDSCWEKKDPETDSTIMRSNSDVKLLGRTISEESLPQEMLENERDFFEDKGSIEMKKDEKKLPESMKNLEEDTKTPPPSPEPKIKPEILDNDHSTLLKVLRDEAESNLSSMTPSLTELEAALSDMLEREDDRGVKEQIIEDKNSLVNREKIDVEKPIEPRILQIEKDFTNSGPPVSLKNILDLSTGFDDHLSFETCPVGEPPEKPSRLHHASLEGTFEKLENVPTPPRRKNRFSGQSSRDRSSLERNSTPENPFLNDRLI